jgi:hypothetical protein
MPRRSPIASPTRPRVGPQDANAVQVYQWALELDPCNIEVLNELGHCMRAAKKYVDCLRMVRKRR